MKRSSMVISLLLLCASGLTALAAGAGVVVPVSQDPSILKALNRMYTKEQLDAGVYVGGETCTGCHSWATKFNDTYHPRALRKPMGMYTLQPGKGVLANYLKDTKDDFMAGLDFNTKTGTAFDAQKPNAPILSYNAADDSYWVQLGPEGIKVQVVATWAGQTATNGQRFMVRIPVTDRATGYSNAIYFAPFAWGGTAYSSNASNWYDGSTPKYKPGIASSALVPLQGQNYLATCSGCHITGIKKVSVTPAGEKVVDPWPASLVPKDSPNYPDLNGDGVPDLVGIGCESCHGPGSAHVSSGGDPTKIFNPNKIASNQQRSDVCLQCHVQTGSAPTQFWGFTYDEVNNKGWVPTNPMEPLTNYQKSKAVKWPDGVAYTTARIDMYKSSAHYQGSHGMSCDACHNPHRQTVGNPEGMQIRETITDSHTGLKIPSLVENDSFCLACHATHGSFAAVTKEQIKDWEKNFEGTIRPVIEGHTHHPYGAERSMGLSNCIGCHMATGHTFIPSRPEDTIKHKDVTTSATVKGNINSCSADCHCGRAILWTDVPANLTPTDKLYNTANEIKLANYLVQYFGPEGAWWKTTSADAKKK